MRQIAYGCPGVTTATGVPDFNYAAVIWPHGDEVISVANHTEGLALLRDLHCDHDAANEEFDEVCLRVFGGTLDDLTLTSAMEMTDSDVFRLLVRAKTEHHLKRASSTVAFAVESRPFVESFAAIAEMRIGFPVPRLVSWH